MNGSHHSGASVLRLTVLLRRCGPMLSVANGSDEPAPASKRQCDGSGVGGVFTTATRE